VGFGEHQSPDFRMWGVRPMVRTPWDAWCWCPFHEEVSKDLALDGMSWLEVELKSSELSCPLGDVARGVGIVEDGP
jgi:hypothetical protein